MPYANVDGVLTFDAFSSLTLAILLLFTGKGLAARIGVLRRYGIPDPVVGGVLCAGVVCVLYYDETRTTLDYHGVLLALFWLNVALMLGQVLGGMIRSAGLMLPDFVGCLLGGIVLRAAGDLLAPEGGRMWRFGDMRPGIALVSDMCLGLFLTMALMGLQLWMLQPMLGFIAVSMVLQVAMAVAFTVFVVFRAMGRDYEAR